MKEFFDLKENNQNFFRSLAVICWVAGREVRPGLPGEYPHNYGESDEKT
jgi:hypothetical protein